MVTAVKGGLERQELVERYAQRINIRPLVDDPTAGQGLLGAHVAEGPDPVAGARQTQIAGNPRQPEIRDPERTVRGQSRGWPA